MRLGRREKVNPFKALKAMFLIVLFFISSLQLSLPSSLQAKKRELERVKRKLRELQVRLRYQKLQESDLYRQLQEVWRKVTFLEREMDTIKAEKKVIDASVKRLERKLKRTEEELQQLKMILRGQVMYLMKNYAPWIIAALIGESDMDVVLDRIYLLKQVISQESVIYSMVAEKQRDIELIKKALAHRRDRLERYEKMLKEKGKLYSSLLKKRQQLLEEIRRQRVTTERKLRYYEEVSEKISREIKLMILREQARRGLVFKGGKLLWPTTSTYITSYFGYRWHPIRGRYLFHSGIDIGNYYGEPIYAAADGVVIYAGWLDGYGKAVIIDHGSGVSTLYAHCSKLLVKKGDVVTAGQIIARVGSTGISTGPHLHFEVRIGGRPVNPLKYLYR